MYNYPNTLQSHYNTPQNPSSPIPHDQIQNQNQNHVLKLLVIVDSNPGSGTHVQLDHRHSPRSNMDPPTPNEKTEKLESSARPQTPPPHRKPPLPRPRAPHPLRHPLQNLRPHLHPQTRQQNRHHHLLAPPRQTSPQRPRHHLRQPRRSRRREGGGVRRRRHRLDPLRPRMADVTESMRSGNARTQHSRVCV